MDMKVTPRHYQMRAAEWLISRPHAGLLLDMGLGKTLISIMVMETLKRPRTLLIAPIRTLYTTWPDELAKWGSKISYCNLHDNLGELYSGESYDMYGINPESSLKLLSDPRFEKQKFELLIVDESSLYKNYASRRFKLLQKHLHRFGRRWILTGTPAPNGLQDIWAQIYIVDRGKSLGEYVTRFRNAFCAPDWNGYGYSMVRGAEEEIYRRIGDYCLRMDSKDYLEMPELIHNSVQVILDPVSRKLYKQMEEEFLIALEEDKIMSPNAAAAGSRCRQIANGGIYNERGETKFIHDLKTEALKEIVEGLQGQPTIVFYEFRHDAARIEKALGKMPPLDTATIKGFQEGKVPILMGHPYSMAHGLNLQGACHNVIWYGIPWDLQGYDQGNARVWRQGQKSSRVVLHHIVAKDTKDEDAMTVLAMKSRTQKRLLDALKERK